MMEALIELLKDYDLSTMIIILILFVLAFFGVYEAVKKVHAVFDSYYKTRAENQEKEDTVNKRLTKLEKANEDDKKQFSSLKSDIADIRKLIEKIQEESESSTLAQKKANRAQSRSAMMRLSNELINRGYASEIESDTLQDLVNVFMQSATKDDSYAIPPTVARAMHLKVYTLEEMEKMHNNPSITGGQK